MVPHRRNIWLGLTASGLLAACAHHHGGPAHHHDPAHHGPHSPHPSGETQRALSESVALSIKGAAEELIEAAPAPLRGRLVLDYGDPMRTRAFCYVLAHCKQDHAGLRVRELTAQGRVALNTLLVTALSSAGYHKAIAAMNREWILEEMEAAHRQDPKTYSVTGSPSLPNWVPPASRGARDFYIALFGKPSTDAPWALRFEGHHLSVNLTFGRQGETWGVGVAPLFLGSSPMIIPQAPGDGFDASRWRAEEGQQLLRREALLARTLLRSLPEPSLQSGRLEALPPAELHGGTAQNPTALPSSRWDTAGIDVSSLSEQSKAHLWDFVAEFLHNHNGHLVDWRAFWGGLESAKLWWFGDIGDVEAELYLRVEGGRYLIELLQSGQYGVNSSVAANHVHSVFRDLENDWDFDVLGHHVHTQHAHDP